MSEHLVLDVAVVGDSGVGKTTLLQEELEEEQSSSLDPTLLGIRLRVRQLRDRMHPPPSSTRPTKKTHHSSFDTLKNRQSS